MNSTSFFYASPSGYDITYTGPRIGDNDCFIQRIVYPSGDEELFLREIERVRPRGQMRSGPIEHRVIRPSTPPLIIPDHLIVDWNREM